VAERLGLIGPAMEQPEYNLLNRKKVCAWMSLLLLGVKSTPSVCRAGAQLQRMCLRQLFM